MTMPIAESVRAFILNYLSKRAPELDMDVARNNDDFDILKAGIIDSMGMLEMIAAMERNFGVTVDFEQIDPEAFTILGPFCHYVAENAVFCEQ